VRYRVGSAAAAATYRASGLVPWPHCVVSCDAMNSRLSEQGRTLAKPSARRSLPSDRGLALPAEFRFRRQRGDRI